MSKIHNYLDSRHDNRKYISCIWWYSVFVLRKWRSNILVHSSLSPSYFSQFIVDFNILTPYFYILRYLRSTEQSQMGIYFNIQTMESHFLLTKILVELCLIPWILRFMMVLGNVKFQTQTMTHIKSKWKPILLFMLLKKLVSSYLLDSVPNFYDFMTW